MPGWPFNRRALAVRKTEEPQQDRLCVVVGGKYPSVFGYENYDLRVDRLVEFMGVVSVHFTVLGVGVTHVDTLDTFCRDIARRIAYENSTMQSVDVTEYFRKYSLTGEGNGG